MQRFALQDIAGDIQRRCIYLDRMCHWYSVFSISGVLRRAARILLFFAPLLAPSDSSIASASFTSLRQLDETYETW